MPDRLRHINILGIPVACATYESALQAVLRMADRPAPAAVCASNTHIISQARHDPSFGGVMRGFDLILPDGMPLVWYLNRRGAGLTDRVYGPYFMRYVLTHSPPETRHFFFGGQPATLDQMVQAARDLNPQIKIAGTYSPPFRTWTEEDEAENARVIRESGADLIWVALGGERQERWIAANRPRHQRGVFLAVGDAFELLAGNRPFAPDWIQKRGLTWLYRLLQEPRRLWPRYFRYNSLFLWYVILEIIGKVGDPPSAEWESSKVQKWESGKVQKSKIRLCQRSAAGGAESGVQGDTDVGGQRSEIGDETGTKNQELRTRNKSTRIAFIGSRGVPAQYSGFETVVAELGKCLVQRGYHVTVYNRIGHYLEHFSEYEGMRIRWFPTIRTKSLDTPVHTILSLLDAVLRRYDLIYLCGVGNAPLSRLLPKLAGAKLIINVDGADYRRAKWGPMGRFWLRRSEREAVKVADAVIADNPEILDRYQRLYDVRPHLISYGTPIGCHYTPTRVLENVGVAPQQYFLFVGRITPENEAHLAIEGYLRFLNQPGTMNYEPGTPPPKLVIVGSAGYEQAYLRDLKELARPGGDNIIFAGGRYGDSYRELSDHALAFVLPAQIEATRLVLLDQMGFGACIVFRDCQATRHVIAESGIAFGSKETDFATETTILGAGEDPRVRDAAEDLGQKLEKIWLDPELRQRKSREAQQRAIDHFSWEAVTDQYEEIFASIKT